MESVKEKPADMDLLNEGGEAVHVAIGNGAAIGALEKIAQ